MSKGLYSITYRDEDNGYVNTREWRESLDDAKKYAQDQAEFNNMTVISVTIIRASLTDMRGAA